MSEESPYENEKVAAHKHSLKSRKELLESEMCGCFYCLAIFPPNSITEWIDEDAGEVALTAIVSRLFCRFGNRL